MTESLTELREQLKACRNCTNPGCSALVDYRDRCKTAGAEHPVLFQIVPKPRVMIIGAVPGGIASKPAKVRYQGLVNGQFCLGYRSAMGLGCIMLGAARLKRLRFSAELESIPITPQRQEIHLAARAQLGLHFTNIVKCYAETAFEADNTSLWHQAGSACSDRFLSAEFRLVDPECVVLLGKQVALWFSARERWNREDLRISEWADEATELPCFGKKRFVTAWPHPGEGYFYAQARSKWPRYAEQLAKWVG